ncbi:hypothetical protein OAK52_02890 [Chloroflexi bacterium]|nr:hypothetical protein [Chloroflexota bacterium]MDC0253091.1 hypothetical protein [Chloroflexota bacterium]RZP13419.1 MAG: hypothetical protein EVA32_04830 [Chloroflexota bacterium]|tara:strand:+ start:20086 stop:20310 length:225 start_codon:yes stop_codon:yes gene_type:complete
MTPKSIPKIKKIRVIKAISINTGIGLPGHLTFVEHIKIKLNTEYIVEIRKPKIEKINDDIKTVFGSFLKFNIFL